MHGLVRTRQREMDDVPSYALEPIEFPARFCPPLGSFPCHSLCGTVELCKRVVSDVLVFEKCSISAQTGVRQEFSSFSHVMRRLAVVSHGLQTVSVLQCRRSFGFASRREWPKSS